MLDSSVWWPFPLGIICDLVAKQRLLPSQKHKEQNYSQLLVGTNLNAKSLVFASWAIFIPRGPFDFWCVLCQDSDRLALVSLDF